MVKNMLDGVLISHFHTTSTWSPCFAAVYIGVGEDATSHLPILLWILQKQHWWHLSSDLEALAFDHLSLNRIEITSVGKS